MKIVVHDYSGHPFQAQLSRELARRGHTVDHVHCASYVSGKGHLGCYAEDPPSLSFTALNLERSFDKYTARRRILQELTYARQFVEHIESGAPDVVLMCNVPLLAHAMIDRRLQGRGVPTVFWHQDVYSHAIGVEARRRLGPLATPIARGADRAERKIARRARSVVAISDHFLPIHERWGTRKSKIHVIPNWAPVDEIVPQPRDNEWARQHDLVGRPVVLYSGTLGLKHNPERLVALIRGVRSALPSALLVVVSEGNAADWLRDTNEPGIRVLPFQPFGQLAEVLGSADLLLTVLEPEASEYSVPSKTLTYLCAGRPVVGILPSTNPAYDAIERSGGLAIALSEDVSIAATAVTELLQNPAELVRRAKLAREFAEANFDIVRIADRFETALDATPDAANYVARQATGG